MTGADGFGYSFRYRPPDYSVMEKRILADLLADMDRTVKTRALRDFDRLEDRRTGVRDPGIRRNLVAVLENSPPDQAVLLAGVFEYLVN